MRRGANYRASAHNCIIITRTFARCKCYVLRVYMLYHLYTYHILVCIWSYHHHRAYTHCWRETARAWQRGDEMHLMRRIEEKTPRNCWLARVRSPTNVGKTWKSIRKTAIINGAQTACYEVFVCVMCVFVLLNLCVLYNVGQVHYTTKLCVRWVVIACLCFEAKHSRFCTFVNTYI